MGKLENVSLRNRYGLPDSVDGRFPLPTDPTTFLASAITEQRALVVSGAFTPFREATESSVRFFNRFKKSNFFKELYGRATQEALRVDAIVNPAHIESFPPLTPPNYIQRLKGLMCEGMTYAYKSSQYDLSTRWISC